MTTYPTVRFIPLPGGIDLTIPPHLLPSASPGRTPRSTNILVRDSLHQKRPGLVGYNAGAALNAAAGVPVSIIQYERETGVIEIVGITGGDDLADRRVYRSAGGSWSDITDAALTDGDLTTDMRGTAIEPYDAAVAPNSTQVDVLYMSNGNNAAFPLNPRVLKWTGSGNCVPITTPPGSARTLTTFANRLVLGYIYDGTSYHGNRIVWSKDGDAEDYTDPSSGIVDLVQTPDLISRLAGLRDRLVIYKTDSIFIGRETGISIIPIGFTLFTRAVGAIAPFSVNGGADRHFFLGRDNVWEFNGASLNPIGTRIRRDLRSINQSALRQIFSFVNIAHSEYWLFVPEGSETYPTSAWVYNWLTQEWHRETFSAQTLTCAARGTTSAGEVWSGTYASTHTWNTASGSWDDYSITGAPTILVGRAAGHASELTNTALNDDGTAINASWETPDFDFAGNGVGTHDLKTLARISLRYKGPGQNASLICEVSTDGGITYTATSPVSASIAATSGMLYFDTWKTSDRFRLRFRNAQTGEPFTALEEIQLFYVPQGEKLP